MINPSAFLLAREQPLPSLAWLPNAVAALTIGLGIAVMAGWLLEIEAVKSLLPGFANMRFNTALGLTLLGVSLWLRSGGVTIPGAPAGAVALALVVMTLAALTLAQYAGGWDFGIDQLLVRDATPSVFPGRMAPHTALVFMLLGTALLAPRWELKGQGVREWLTLIAMFVALLALMGQSYRATPLYGVTPYTGMALHTAGGFLLLSVGVLFVQPQQRLVRLLLARSAGGVTVRVLLPAVLIIPVVLTWLLVHEGEHLGIYNREVAIALAVTGGMALLVVLIWRHASLLNVLEQARMQMAAAQSEALLQAIGDSVNEAIYVKDRETRLMFANSAASRIFGAGNVDLIGSTNKQLLRDSIQAERMTESDLRVMATGQGETVEEVLYLPDGEARYYLSSKVPLRDERNQITGLIGISTDITARKIAEETLRQRIEENEQLLKILPVAVWRALDPACRIVTGNSFAQRLLPAPSDANVSADESLENRTWVRHLLDGREMSAEELPLQRTTASGCAIENLEFTIERSDGHRVDLLCNTAPLYDAEDHIRGAVAACMEMTTRKKAESALRESEARYRILTEVSPQVVWTADPDGNITYANQHWFTYSGQSREQSLGEGWAAALHPDDHERLMATFRQALANGIPYEMDARLRRADGAYRWHLSRAQPQRDEAGHIVQWLGVSVDIHERRQAELELREHQARLNFVLQTTRVGLWFNELPFAKLNWDELTKALFFVPPGVQPTIELFWQRLHPEDREPTRRAVEHAIAENSSYDIEHRVINPETAEVRWLRSAGHAFYGPDRTPTRFDGINYDITQTKRAEADLRRYAEELQATDRRKDQFLAMLAHELRNPLAPIRNAAEILRVAKPTAPAAEKAREMIERQTKYLVRLVDDLLDVSRVTQGKITLKRENVALSTVMNQAIEIAAPLIEAGRHQLTVFTPPADTLMHVDPVRVSQAIGNVLNNAAKYTPKGGQISLRCEQEGNEVAIKVRDNGVGLAADMLPHVFELFTQADRSLDRAQGGLGIGLSLVKSLIELHGGRVEAHSEGLGHGSEFVLRLPLAL